MSQTKFDKRILIWSGIIIPVLALVISAYSNFFGSDTTNKTFPGDSNSNNKIDSVTLTNSNIVTGNGNSVNSNNTTVNNNHTTVNNNYYIQDGTSVPSGFNLIPADNSCVKNIYRGTETFVRCSGESLSDFKFLSLGKINGEFKIKWGDGTPDTTFKNIAGNLILSHTFPQGNSIVKVEEKIRGKYKNIGNYNVFLGTNPAGAIGSNGNLSVCLNQSLEFQLSGFKNNPPWTIYTFTIDDGSKPVSFLVPKENTTTIKHLFSRLPIPKKGGSKPNSQEYFTATLEIENPCSKVLFKISPIKVNDCK